MRILCVLYEDVCGLIKPLFLGTLSAIEKHIFGTINAVVNYDNVHDTLFHCQTRVFVIFMKNRMTLFIVNT
jgi:hypothetical protein